MIPEVVQNEADLGWFYASLPAALNYRSLIVHGLAHLFGIEFLKHQRLLLLIRHLLQMVPKWLILGIKKDAGTEDPYACKHALVILETQIQNDLGLARSRRGP